MTSTSKLNGAPLAVVASLPPLPIHAQDQIWAALRRLRDGVDGDTLVLVERRLAGEDGLGVGVGDLAFRPAGHFVAVQRHPAHAEQVVQHLDTLAGEVEVLGLDIGAQEPEMAQHRRTLAQDGGVVARHVARGQRLAMHRLVEQIPGALVVGRQVKHCAGSRVGREGLVPPWRVRRADRIRRRPKLEHHQPNNPNRHPSPDLFICQPAVEPVCQSAVQPMHQGCQPKRRTHAQEQHHHHVHAADRAAELDEGDEFVEQAVGQGHLAAAGQQDCLAVDLKRWPQRQQREDRRAEQVETGGGRGEGRSPTFSGRKTVYSLGVAVKRALRARAQSPHSGWNTWGVTKASRSAESTRVSSKPRKRDVPVQVAAASIMGNNSGLSARPKTASAPATTPTPRQVSRRCARRMVSSRPVNSKQYMT